MHTVTRGLIIAAIAAAGGCSDSPATIEPDSGATPPPDASAPPVDPPLVGAARGPSLGLDSVALTGANAAFRGLGDLVLNAQLVTAIRDGSLVLIAELIDLNDATNDPSLSLALHAGVDVDQDPTNNYSATAPDDFVVSDPEKPLAMLSASITNSQLRARLTQPITVAGFTLVEADIVGNLMKGANGSIDALTAGKLSGPTKAAQLGATALPAGTLPCPGKTLLDILVRGCVILAGVQPDTDLDGDGLERFSDTNADGQIDRCVDGNSTVFTGIDCWNRPEFADGYLVEITIHGTEVLLYDPL